MNKRELANTRLFVPMGGGNVECVSPDGDILWTAGVQPGIQYMDQMRQFMGPQDELRLSKGLTLMKATGHRVQAQKTAHAAKSGANPDYVPTPYTKAEADMRKLLKEVRAESKALQKRQKAFERVLEKRPAPEPEPEVVEPDTTPEPELTPEPKPKAKAEPAPAK